MTRVFSDFFTTYYPDLSMHRTAMAAVRNGYAVVPVEPGGKRPLCTLPSRDRAKDPRHECGVHHAITDDKVASRVFQRLARDMMGRQPNIGIVAHPSRLVVVDADVPDAVTGFLERWATAEADEGYLTRSPTVSTPGSRRGDEWRHHDGGHWYFDVPEGIDLPVMPGQLLLPGGADVRWGMLMTVAPPSQRPEGAYVVHGDVPTLPAWLLHTIRDHLERRAERGTRDAERFANDAIARWSMGTMWAQLLEPDGWRDTTKLDSRCGCPVFERPGGGASSERSAIGHYDDCPLYENIEGHGALHLFTTDPPEPLAEWCRDHGTSTLTKLQYVAAVHHAGDVDVAKVALGIDPDFEAIWAGIGQSASAEDVYVQESWPIDRNLDPQPAEQVEQPKIESATDPPERHPLAVMAEDLAERIGVPLGEARKVIGNEWLRREARTTVDRYLGAETGDGSTWLPRGQDDMLRALRRDRSVRAEGVLERSDGATLFPVGKLHQLYGQSSAGKTFLAMVAILQQVMAGHRALYCDFEDSLETFIDRYAVDLGVDVEPYIRAGLLHYANPSEPPGDPARLIELGFRLVAVDSLSEVVSATADGSLRDGVLIRRTFRTFRAMAIGGASVIVIAHGSEKLDVPGSSLGASEIRQSLTGQDVLLHEKRPFDSRTAGHSLIYVAKDRGSDAGGDTDLSEHAPTKVQRRLWGAMTVEPHPPVPELGQLAWYTSISIEPATHAEQEPPKVRAIDVAEQLVIKYLNGRPEQTARLADLIDDVVDEHDVAERTVRRALRRLLEDGMAHEIDQSASATGGKPSPIIKLGPAE